MVVILQYIVCIIALMVHIMNGNFSFAFVLLPIFCLTIVFTFIFWLNNETINVHLNKVQQ